MSFLNSRNIPRNTLVANLFSVYTKNEFKTTNIVKQNETSITIARQNPMQNMSTKNPMQNTTTNLVFWINKLNQFLVIQNNYSLIIHKNPSPRYIIEFMEQCVQAKVA